MPWKESCVMSERMKFLFRLEDGEKMSDLCREFGISRKTGYKILDRYRKRGLDGVFDESRRPINNPNKTSESVESLILNLKSRHPTWGAGKLREYLLRKNSTVKFPSKNTFHNILLKHDLVKTRRKRIYRATGTNLRSTKHPNDLWCADYKGEFRMKNNKYCYPLTITDHKSRYLLSCEGLESTKLGGAYSVFESVFEQYGLPLSIRTDNGVPFSCPTALLGLSKLSAWWLRLGIEIERIRPGNPQENGRHERMHLTLKQDLLRTPSKNILKQQEVFDDFIYTFNHERPHEGLENETPASVYKSSPRKYTGVLPEVKYPDCEMIQVVRMNGKMSIKANTYVHISESLIKQPIGIKEIDDKVWRLQFMDIILGHYDEKENEFSKMTEIVKV